jgi:hypothetical protein
METLATPESRVGKPQKRRTRAKIALIAGATLIVAGVGVAGTATAQASDWLGGVEYTQYFKNNEGLWGSYQKHDPEQGISQILMGYCSLKGGVRIEKAGSPEVHINDSHEDYRLIWHYSCWR